MEQRLRCYWPPQRARWATTNGVRIQFPLEVLYRPRAFMESGQYCWGSCSGYPFFLYQRDMIKRCIYLTQSLANFKIRACKNRATVSRD